MINNISGRERILFEKPPPTKEPLTEEEMERRLLVRDIMSRLDFNQVKFGMRKSRRRFTEDHIAQNGLMPRPSVFIPATDDRLTKVGDILKSLKSEEDEGTLRMSLIDKMLAELAAEKADSTTKNPAVILELSENAKKTYLSS